jgi:hypothetical protein
MSPGVHRLTAWLAGQEIFSEVSEVMEKVGGVELSESWVRDSSETLGQEWEQQDQQQIGRYREDLQAPPGACVQQMYLQADGTSVHLLDGWHEVKLGAVFQMDTSGKEPQRVGTQYVGGLEPAEDFFWRLFSQATTQGALRSRQIIALGDGAPWIWKGFDQHFPQAVQIVDWYHAQEHLWTVAKACFGEGSRQTQRWAQAQIDRLWEGNVEGVFRSLKRLRPRSHEARETVRTNLGYFQENQDRMRYGRFRSRGYFIGSGVIESACKQIVSLRMKRSSMRWSRPGAQAILNLRCSLLSGRFYQNWSRYRAAA